MKCLRTGWSARGGGVVGDLDRNHAGQLDLVPRWRREFTLAAGLFFGALMTGAWGASTLTQTFTLRPGWNTVYLAVQPEPTALSSALVGIPIDSVWTYQARSPAVDFVQNVNEPIWNRDAWLVYLPTNRTESFQNTLHHLQAHRAYLLKLNGASPVTWNVTGTPIVRALEWTPNAYNLRGFPVDSPQPPTFLEYFRPSAAHYNPALGQLQTIYRLADNGRWTPVDPAQTIGVNEAYWVYTRGATSYGGPLELSVEAGDRLDFGDTLDSMQLTVRNAAGQARVIRIQDLAGAGSLAYARIDPVEGQQWLDLPAPLTFELAAGETRRLRLAIRRAAFTTERYESVLEVADGAGIRHRVAIRAVKRVAPESVRALAGLWLGTATINAVSEVRAQDPTLPQPTRTPFSFRVLIHVDAAGQARLLKEVIQMWRDGSYKLDADGNRIVDKPGRYVLLTDESRIGLFKGSALRDGVTAGRRISTVGYDFPSTAATNYLALTGDLGQQLTATLTLPFDHPTNPFLHRYHPDHDNLAVRFDGPATEAYALTRELEFAFTAQPPEGQPTTPDYGYTQLGGIYRERIQGLHKLTLHLRGTFMLTRISLIDDLNPSPVPE